jgi:hypothetical protein
LLVEIDEAVRLNNARTALKKADRLLTIKRGHRRALEVQQQFAGAGEAGGVGLEDVKSDWKKAGWIPWSALAFGLLVCAATAGGLFWWLGRTVIVINADQPGLAISLSGKNALVTVSGKQSIAVAPGKQELTVSSPGFESVTRTFPLDKGHTQRVHVSIEDNKIVVDVEAQLPDIVEKTDERASPPKPQPPAAKVPPSLPKAATKERRKPPEKQLAASPAAARAKPAAPAKPPTAASDLLTAPFDEAQAKRAQQDWAERLKVPVEITNSLGMKLRLIPPGEFEHSHLRGKSLVGFDSNGVDEELGPDPALHSMLTADPGRQRSQSTAEDRGVSEVALDGFAIGKQPPAEGAFFHLVRVHTIRT